MTLSRITPLALCVALFGCSSSSSSSSGTPVDSGVDDASSSSMDAGADTAAPIPSTCADPTTKPDAPCGTPSWQTSSVASRLRNHHVTFIAETKAGPMLYAMGGVNAGVLLQNVDRVPLGSDGSLGAWVDDMKLPNAVGGHTGAIVGSVIVVAGGQTLNGVTDVAHSAVVQDDGTLAAWAPAGSVGQKRMHGGSFVVNDTIYVLGGFDDPDVWDDAVSAKVSQDGTVWAWAPAGKLIGKRSHFSVNKVGDYVYMTGGLDASALDNPPLLDEVMRGHILADGTLGEWTAMPKLLVPLATHSGFFFGGYLYVGGGINSTQQEKRFWRAPIGDDHALGAWELSAPLPLARGHVHQLPVFGPHVYSVSGALDFNLTSSNHVEVATFQ